MTAPIVPAINDSEIERILEAAREAGATEAGYVLLRLPLELKELFREWLATEFPERAARVINVLRSMHGGKDYTPRVAGPPARPAAPTPSRSAPDSGWRPSAWASTSASAKLRTDLFRRPTPQGGQLPLL